MGSVGREKMTHTMQIEEAVDIYTQFKAKVVSKEVTEEMVELPVR